MKETITTLNPYKHVDLKTKLRHRYTLKYLKNKIKSTDTILDIGQRNPLTDKLQSLVYCKIDNTSGALDTYFSNPSTIYDVIIYSHTIEHQYNPLNTLIQIKEVMDLNTRMFIFLPRRTKILWTKYHYHEIDDYRMRLLIDRAGLKIVSSKLFKTWRNPLTYLKGFRMMLRLFLEFDVVYEIKK
jgi:hypothetical protein